MKSALIGSAISIAQYQHSPVAQFFSLSGRDWLAQQQARNEQRRRRVAGFAVQLSVGVSSEALTQAEVSMAPLKIFTW
jgi:hypothetical protein